MINDIEVLPTTWNILTVHVQEWLTVSFHLTD